MNTKHMATYTEPDTVLSEDYAAQVPPIRASLTRLPKCTQHFLTWLTACALPGQKPLWPNSPGIQVAMSFLRLFLAIGLSMLMTDSMVHILADIA